MSRTVWDGDIFDEDVQPHLSERKKRRQNSSYAQAVRARQTLQELSLEETSTCLPSPPSPPRTPPPPPQEEETLELEDIFDDDSLPIVLIEEHTSDDQTLMSGVVASLDTLAGQLGEDADDNIHCSYDAVVHKMPYRVVRREELISLNEGEEVDYVFSKVPWNFLTTYLGIKLAIEEWNGLKAWKGNDPEYEMYDWDEELLASLMRRGGYAPDQYQQIIYPEDIVPAFLEDQDQEYWLELSAQAQVWNEMPEIPDFRDLRYR